jgi:hypothetical protein
MLTVIHYSDFTQTIVHSQLYSPSLQYRGQTLSPLLVDIVDYGIGLSYRPPSISPRQGLRIFLHSNEQ